MRQQYVSLLYSKKDDEVAVRVLSTHPTPPVTDHERAVPVSAQQQER